MAHFYVFFNTTAALRATLCGWGLFAAVLFWAAVYPLRLGASTERLGAARRRRRARRGRAQAHGGRGLGRLPPQPKEEITMNNEIAMEEEKASKNEGGGSRTSPRPP
jgi:hypothetical protein